MNRRQRGSAVASAVCLLALTGCGHAVAGFRASGTPSISPSPSGRVTPTQAPVPPGLDVGGLAVVGAKSAWLTVGTPPVLKFTDDEGQTWQTDVSVQSLETRLPPGKTWQAAPGFFLDRNNLWLGFDTGGQSGDVEVLRTTDGGQTWTSSALPTTEFSIYLPVLEQVRLLDATRGWAVLDSATTGCDLGTGHLLITNDGGSTWHVSPLPAPCGQVFLNGSGSGWFERKGALPQGRQGTGCGQPQMTVHRGRHPPSRMRDVDPRRM